MRVLLSTLAYCCCFLTNNVVVMGLKQNGPWGGGGGDGGSSDQLCNRPVRLVFDENQEEFIANEVINETDTDGMHLAVPCSCRDTDVTTGEGIAYFCPVSQPLCSVPRTQAGQSLPRGFARTEILGSCSDKPSFLVTTGSIALVSSLLIIGMGLVCTGKGNMALGYVGQCVAPRINEAYVNRRLLNVQQRSQLHWRANSVANDGRLTPVSLRLKTMRVRPNFLHSSTNNDDDDECCTICFAPLLPGDRVGVIPCHHNFHVSCLKKWLCRKNCCPLCQTKDVAEYCYRVGDEESS